MPSKTQKPALAGIGAIFPVDSYAVLECAGLGHLRKAAERHELFSLFQGACERSGLDLDKVSRGDFSRGLRMFRRGLAEIDLSPDDVRALFSGPFAIGIGRPSLRSFMTPSLLISLDVRGREERVAQTVAKLERLLPHALEELGDANPTWSSVRMGDAKVRRLEVQGFRIHYATHRGRLLLGTGQGYFAHALEVLDGQAKGIHQHPTYRRGLQRLGEDPMLTVTLNTKPLMQAFGPFMPYDAEELCDVLGIGEMRGLWFGSAMTSKGSRDEFVADFDGEPRGLLKALFSKPGKGLGAKFCGRKTIMHVSGSIDGEGLLHSAHKLIDMLPGEARREIQREIDREFHRELDRELGQFGMSHQDVVSLAKMLTGEVAVAAQIDGTLPQFLGFVEFKDGAKAKDFITSRLGKLFTGEELPKLRYRKSRDYWFVSVRERRLQLTPSIAFRGNTMIVSPYKNAIEEALKRYDERGPSLANDADYRAAMQRLGPAAWSGTFRYSSILESCWPFIVAGAPQALSEISDDLSLSDLFPDKEALFKAFGSAYGAVSADRKGIYSSGIDPLGLGVLLSYAGWGGDWLLRQASGKLD